MRGRPLAGQLGLVLASGLLTIGALEAGLRLAGYRFSPLLLLPAEGKGDFRAFHLQADPLVLFDPDLFWRPNPSVWADMDADGVRGRPARAADETLIIAVGDSNTIGDPGPMGRILVRGEPGHAIVPELAPRAGEAVIDKPGKGAFHATGLQDDLARRGLTHLVMMGVTTEVCVQTTMCEANDRGYECLLVEDGTESYFPQFKQAALEMIRAQGAIVGWTATTDELAASLHR